MDSAGTMVPEQVDAYVRALKAAVAIPVGFHGHNNLGLSVANALAAQEAGATVFDCGLLGMARSAGNCATELAAAAFQAFLMAHEPTDEHPAKDMTPAQLANLERCYSTVLPLMAKLGKEQSEDILRYGETYLQLFPEGKHKTAVQNAMNQAKADK